MDLSLLIGVIRARARLASHERWTREQLLAHQARALAELRTYATAHSPFYRELHRGLEQAPLEALPSVTKATLMERFDDIVTDRDVRLREVEAYLARATVEDVFRRRYRVAATGGTTGRRGVFLAGPAEWTAILASYARAYAWAGVAPGITNRIRQAVVSSRNPSHQSSIVGGSVASPFVPTLRLDATQPVAEIVAALNDFRPETLVGYASILGVLAGEQLDGRLHVAVRAVMSASEVLTQDTRRLIGEAFGVRATNVYAATETAGLASECRFGHLHRYEDLVIAEIVDADNRPVQGGVAGDKLLVSVLFSRTQPLIRYELSDRVIAGDPSMATDLPFATLAGIEGREEEVLQLGGISAHPNLFHNALEGLATAGWQVVDEGSRLRITVVQPIHAEASTVQRSVVDALAASGVRDVAVVVELVDSIPRTALGKAPLVRRAPRDETR